MRLHLNPINARRNQSTRAAKEVGGSDRLCVRSLLRSYRPFSRHARMRWRVRLYFTKGLGSLAGHTYLRAHVGGARKERGEW